MALTQAADLSLGERSEHTLTERLSSQFGAPLQRRGGFHIFDYFGSANGKTIEVELKTRRIRHNDYPTALIGANKIAYCSDPNIDYYFVFCYSDGIYYIKYDATVFTTFERRDDFVRSTRTDTPTVVQQVVYIPTNLLISL